MSAGTLFWIPIALQRQILEIKELGFSVRARVIETNAGRRALVGSDLRADRALDGGRLGAKGHA
jgi:hypothetical protein